MLTVVHDDLLNCDVELISRMTSESSYVGRVKKGSGEGESVRKFYEREQRTRKEEREGRDRPRREKRQSYKKGPAFFYLVTARTGRGSRISDRGAMHPSMWARATAR